MLIDKFETGSNGFVWQNAQPDELPSRVQFHVYTAHRSKVGKDWCGDKFVNHYNRIYYVNSGSATLRFKDQTVNMQAGYLYLISAAVFFKSSVLVNVGIY